MIKRFGLIIACAAITSAVNAQKVDSTVVVSDVTEEIQYNNDKYKVETNHFFDNWFVSGGFGGQVLFGNHDKQVKFFNRIAPALDIAVGKWFTPGIGVRLMYSGLSVKGATQKEGHGEFPTHSTGEDVPGKGGDGYWLMKQKFKFYNLHLDALFNMSNILYGYNEKRVYNCSPYFGLGWTRVWKSPQSMEVSANVGILNSFRLNDALDLNLDIRGAYVSDRFDGELGGRWGEGLWSATIGLTYKFKPRGWDRSKTIIRTHDRTSELKAMQDKLNDMQAQLAKRKTDSITVIRTMAAASFVVFKIDTWDLTNEARVQLSLFAENIKKADPNVIYIITGYADKGTGSVERNIVLSKNRARVVYECLVNEFGVPKKQLRIDHKGGVDDMFYNDPRMSRAVITKILEEKE
ncbi:OmpA family protein [Bacteroides caecigallinarum]|uniref:OmpA family protein n=1 Tax=Bacteroides caecigallinarum TaxID=1411144 RepID=UPI0019588A1A|nr:OmpA family protein [Bacteroides caecigallinarum]MBM6882027.1 OmpA family protein [Bacteroides caecigallinarum]